MEKDARRERSSEFAWSSGISCCDNFKSTAETPFQIWSQWVKNLTKCGLGRSQVRAIIPRFGDVSADIAQPPGCGRCGVTYVTASPAWMKLAQIVIHPSKIGDSDETPITNGKKARHGIEPYPHHGGASLGSVRRTEARYALLHWPAEIDSGQACKTSPAAGRALLWQSASEVTRGTNLGVEMFSIRAGPHSLAQTRQAPMAPALPPGWGHSFSRVLFLLRCGHVCTSTQNKTRLA